MLGLDFTKNQKLALLALIGLSAIALSVAFSRNRAGGDEVVLREPGSAPAQVVATDSDPMPYSGDQNRPGKVVVHVVGCVNMPGVYTLPTGSRVFEAIKAAGGAKPSANLQAINLAARAEDGSRIEVPSTQPSAPQAPTYATAATACATGASSAASTGGKLQKPGEGTVNINRAAVDEMQRLPGVGPSTAEKIVEYRSQIGRFTSPEQLMDVKGIGPKKLEKMRPFIAL